MDRNYFEDDDSSTYDNADLNEYWRQLQESQERFYADYAREIEEMEPIKETHLGSLTIDDWLDTLAWIQNIKEVQ